MSADATSSSTESFEQVQCPAPLEPRSAATLLSLAVQPITNSLRWLRTRLEQAMGAAFTPIGGLLPLPVTSVQAVADTLTLAGHGLVNGDEVRLVLIGAAVAPAGLAAGTVYYVVNKTASTVQLSATSGGAPIDITDGGSGTFYLVKVVDPEIYLPSSGTLPPAKMSSRFLTAAYTGNVTITGVVTATLGFISGAGVQVGGVLVALDNIAASKGITMSTQVAPSAPAAGKLTLYWDGTNLKAIDSASVVHTIF